MSCIWNSVVKAYTARKVAKQLGRQAKLKQASCEQIAERLRQSDQIGHIGELSDKVGRLQFLNAFFGLVAVAMMAAIMLSGHAYHALWSIVFLLLLILSGIALIIINRRIWPLQDQIEDTLKMRIFTNR